MLHIVDDDEAIRDALSWLAKSRAIVNISYDSGAAFLSALDSNMKFDSHGDCLLLDVRMPDINGGTLFDVLVARNLTQKLPVIFLTAHGEEPMTADSLQHDAFDFFEKPFNDNTLMDRVQEAFLVSMQAGRIAAFKSRLKTLSVQEQEVLELILTVKTNKTIENKLGISVNTVKVHRKNIFDKLNVKSEADLARMMKLSL